jgi:hypothetical protein
MLVVMTITQNGTGFKVRAIAADVVRELLAADDTGRRPVLLTDDVGGAPLRCCLRPSRPGEQVALVSYAPLRRWARETGARPGPYDELGPVFLHARPCAGPDGTGYPGWLAAGNRVLRAYGADGRILGGQLVQADPACSPVAAESALARMLAGSEVALVHGRALEFGCFIFEARRVRPEPLAG